jgi:hypothetical protein
MGAGSIQALGFAANVLLLTNSSTWQKPISGAQRNG